MTNDTPRKADPREVEITAQADGVHIDAARTSRASGNSTPNAGTWTTFSLGDPKGSAVFRFLMTGSVRKPGVVTPLEDKAG
jgi:hypothetical protein